MSRLERAFRGVTLRASREVRDLPPQIPETRLPIYSEAFLEAQRKQSERDTRMAAIVPTMVRNNIGFGQDRTVDLLITEDGSEYVAKKLKDSSRPYMVFGLGIPAGEIPCDTDTTGAREELVKSRADVVVDPHVVADKLRLTHILADTYLDRGDHLILPTATVVVGDEVQDRQRYIPKMEPYPGVVRDFREVALEEQEKVKLFRKLQERWKDMIRTPDFKNMPSDVQDYWTTFPPDSGYGTNARFLGLGNVLAIDY